MTLGQFFFKNRSYTPLPLLIPLFIFGRPTIISLIIGFIIVAIGESIRFWGVAYAGGETRTTKIGASNFVTQGPYAYIRNPLYAGNILMYFGVSVMGNSLFPYLQVIGLLYFYLQYRFIVIEEEKFLKDKFKERYDDYYRSVPAFITNFKPYDLTKQSKLKFNFNEAYRSEKRTFQAIFSMILMILLIFILIQG